MECNKDEAIRAKEIAETKLTEKDILGAQRFALKAQNLYAGLDGLSKLLQVINVYANSLKMINGEVDWYSVIGVDPKVDHETLRKQYLRMALALHPDKNKSTGADEAFRIISEAWNLLSDKDKRAHYDERTSVRNVEDENPSMETSQNPFFSNPMLTPSAKPPTTSKPPLPPKRSSTFWTLCTRCFMKFEYPSKYLNDHLICKNCRVQFFAMEVPAPNQTSSVLFGQSNVSRGSTTPMHSGLGFQSWKNNPNPFSSKGGNGVSMPSSGAKLHQTGESLKTGEDANTSNKRKDSSSSEEQVGSIKRRRVDEQKMNREMAAKTGSSSNANASKEVLLMEKAVLEIRTKANEWNAENTENTLFKEKNPTAIATAAPDS